MAQEVMELNQAERDWLQRNEVSLRGIAAVLGTSPDASQPLDPDCLDRTWRAWLEHHLRGQEDPNPLINAFGIGFGAWLALELALEWKVVKDEGGTEVALIGQPGDITIFPTNLVAKRYVAGTAEFFVAVAREMAESIARIRAH
jgi:hypothetical protein